MVALLIGGCAGAMGIVITLGVIALASSVISRRTEVTPGTVNDQTPPGAVPRSGSPGAGRPEAA